MSNRTTVLPVDPDSAAAARRFLRQESLPLDQMRFTEADLLVTEVVGNVVRHAPSAEDFELATHETLQGLRVLVSHASPNPIDSEAVPGAGFTLLDRISQAWGHDFEDETLTVWFDLRTPGTAEKVATMSDEELLEWIDVEPVACSDELVRRHSDLAESIAARYRGKGVADEDLHQVSLMALLKAIQRFDRQRGELRPYAAATISGEMKKTLRDRAWSVRVARSLQEDSLHAAKVSDRMTQELGRAPTSHEVAKQMDRPVEEVEEALSARLAYKSKSIDDSHGSSEQSALIARLGDLDDRMLNVENRILLEEAIAGLPNRQQQILLLRVNEDLTQSEIADIVGISQMHVSRLLSRALETLKSRLD